MTASTLKPKAGAAGAAPGPRVLLYVQHLLGTGHLRRTAVLAQTLSARGFGVLAVSGGLPAPGVTFGDTERLQLPALKAADIAFSGLIDVHGRTPGRGMARASA